MSEFIFVVIRTDEDGREQTLIGDRAFRTEKGAEEFMEMFQYDPTLLEVIELELN